MLCKRRHFRRHSRQRWPGPPGGKLSTSGVASGRGTAWDNGAQSGSPSIPRTVGPDRPSNPGRPSMTELYLAGIPAARHGQGVGRWEGRDSHVSPRIHPHSGEIGSSSIQLWAELTVDSQLDSPKRSGLVDLPEAHHPYTTIPARVGALLFEETGECFSTQGFQSGECLKGARGEPPPLLTHYRRSIAMRGYQDSLCQMFDARSLLRLSFLSEWTSGWSYLVEVEAMHRAPSRQDGTRCRTAASVGVSLPRCNQLSPLLS